MARNYDFAFKESSNSSTRSHYGHASKPTGITIHHWGSTGQKFENVVAWLRGPKGGTSNRGSSAHYVVEAGRVNQLVGDSRAAWHAGSTPGNGSTIGIECRPEMSDGDWATLVQLCADLEEEHGSMKYYGHKDWKSTACPGSYYAQLGKLVKDVNAEHAARKKGGTTAPKPSKPSKPSKPNRPVGEVPGPGYDFPWPSGHYIGPKDGPDRSHSGFYTNRKWSGQYDEVWLKRFASQLALRGWSVGKGKTYLSKFGNDGRFGAEYEALIRAFQNSQGLAVDGLGGRDTWDEAFKEPVT
jgi:peptidoglycan hydrolase-like protein with peptidoglycan-binding domain